MSTYLEQSLSKLKDFEGSVPWMYRDTVGRVTVGVGLMLPNSAAACALPFVVNGVAASREAIAAEYERVDALPPGRSAGFYRRDGGLELTPAEIDSLLRNVLTGFENGVRARLRGYDALPDTVKLALLDMAYNLGVGGLFHEYPKMLQAVEAGDWSAAAAACARHGIGDLRNAWTRGRFLAATVVKAIEAAEEESAAERLLYGAIGWAAEQLER